MVWAILGAVLVSGCEAHSCTAAGCGGESTSVSLVNERGEPMRVQGEARIRGPRYESSAAPFDCTQDSFDCEGGVLSAAAPSSTEDVLELRFRLPDGGFTEWQTFDLEVSAHTDPDFNGPDCPCTWHEAAPLSVVVPDAAQPG